MATLLRLSRGGGHSLDADADLSWDVDARFHREAHALLDDHVVACHDGRKFVDVHAQTMSQAVVEVFPITSLFNHLAGRCVHLRGRHARLDKVLGRQLGF